MIRHVCSIQVHLLITTSVHNLVYLIHFQLSESLLILISLRNWSFKMSKRFHWRSIINLKVCLPFEVDSKLKKLPQFCKMLMFERVHARYTTSNQIDWKFSEHSFKRSVFVMWILYMNWISNSKSTLSRLHHHQICVATNVRQITEMLDILHQVLYDWFATNAYVSRDQSTDVFHS